MCMWKPGLGMCKLEQKITSWWIWIRAPKKNTMTRLMDVTNLLVNSRCNCKYTQWCSLFLETKCTVQSSKFRITARTVSIYIHRMSDFLLVNPTYLAVPGVPTPVGSSCTINTYKSVILRPWHPHGSSVHCICLLRMCLHCSNHL